jgi:hypothetical protein
LKRKLRLFAAAFSLMLLMSGCSISEIDELYSLPQPPKGYLQLQELIDAEIKAGSEYSAPTAGSLRQSVQLVDLDGDGTNEALAFLRNKDKQPEICIYHRVDGNYALAARITGDGTAVGRVEYADIDGDGISEILTSWEVNSDMRLLKAYSIKDWSTSVILTASCVDFQIGDLNSDGVLDILALNLELSGGHVDMFLLDSQKNVIQKTVKLSSSLKTADRFRIANIADGIPAVFVEGSFTDNGSSFLLTDIIVCSDGELRNITMDSAEGDSYTQRQYPVYCTDIDGNGSLDVPFAEKLKSPPVGVAEYYIFDWYTYDLNGKSELCASTYHCYTDGWYFTLPAEWRDNLTVRRESTLSGERAIVLSADEGSGETADLLTIYTLTDENRSDRAKLDGRFILISSGTVIYAAEINTDSNHQTYEAEKRDIINRFHLISSEWITGAL